MPRTVGLLSSLSSLRVLPSAVATPRLSARAWIALAAGIGCGVCAYAGLYPRFDDGALRTILGVTSVPFGAAVVAASLSARSAWRAFGMALFCAVLLGAASTVIPAAILTFDRRAGFFFACFMGGLFGGLTGLFYGVPLAILAAVGHRHVGASTHDATDRAARISGVWLTLAALAGLCGTQVLDPPTQSYATEEMTHPAMFPSIVAVTAALAGVVLVAVASLRTKRRRAWVDRVRAGLEPSFRTRVADVRDRVEVLPRLSDGETVIELVLDDSSGAAYRVAATGTAVAVVSDSR